MALLKIDGFNHVLRSLPLLVLRILGSHHRAARSGIFRCRIGSYLDIHAQTDLGLKRYVKVVSTCLAFLAKRPLHLPGIELDGGIRIIKRGSYYCCNGKNSY